MESDREELESAGKGGVGVDEGDVVEGMAENEGGFENRGI